MIPPPPLHGAAHAAEACAAIPSAVGREAGAAVESAISKRCAAAEAMADGDRASTQFVTMRLPRRAALALQHTPQLALAAERAVTDRDLVDDRAVRKEATFGSAAAGPGSIVEASVRLTRWTYAKLLRAPHAATQRNRTQVFGRGTAGAFGAKITAGLEVLCDRQRRVRAKCGEGAEVAVDREDPEWLAFRERLVAEHNYFGDEAWGSRRFQELDRAARVAFAQTRAEAGDDTRAEDVAHRALTLVEGAGDGEVMVCDETDAAWIEVSPEEADRRFAAAEQEVQRGMEGVELDDDSDGEGGGDAFDPRGLVKGMAAFLDKLADYTGAEIPGAEGMESGGEESADEFDGDDDFDFGGFLDALGVAHPALNGEHSPQAAADLAAEQDALESMMAAMDSELARKTDGSFAPSFGGHATADAAAAGAPPNSSVAAAAAAAGDGDGGELDFSLVKGFLDSFAEEHGDPGAASVLMTSLGVKAPKKK